jgi:hypothetical protein
MGEAGCARVGHTARRAPLTSRAPRQTLGRRSIVSIQNAILECGSPISSIPAQGVRSHDGMRCQSIHSVTDRLHTVSHRCRDRSRAFLHVSGQTPLGNRYESRMLRFGGDVGQNESRLLSAPRCGWFCRPMSALAHTHARCPEGASHYAGRPCRDGYSPFVSGGAGDSGKAG